MIKINKIYIYLILFLLFFGIFAERNKNISNQNSPDKKVFLLSASRAGAAKITRERLEKIAREEFERESTLNID